MSIKQRSDITIVIPCRVDKEDIQFARRLLKHLYGLNPRPCHIHVHYNKEGYRAAQINAIRKGFLSAPIVVRLAVDVWPVLDFLRYVNVEGVTSFNGLTMTRSDLSLQLIRLLHYSKGWTGLFALDLDTWLRVYDSWNGLDYHMRVLVGRNNYKFVGNMKFKLLRSYEVHKTRELLRNMRKRKRLWWQLSRLRPVKLF